MSYIYFFFFAKKRNAPTKRYVRARTTKRSVRPRNVLCATLGNPGMSECLISGLPSLAQFKIINKFLRKIPIPII
jgi:hypothetical protein